MTLTWLSKVKAMVHMACFGWTLKTKVLLVEGHPRTIYTKLFSNQHIYPPPPVPYVADRSRAVFLLLLIHCFMYLPLFVGVLCLSLFCNVLHGVLSSLAIILMKKRELVALL